MLHRFLEEGLRGKSATTIRTYEHAIKQFDEWLQGAGTNLEEYSRSDVQQYIDYLASKKKTAATINKIWSAIKLFSKWAGKNAAIEDISVVKQADIKKQAPKSLDTKERNRLIRELDRAGNARDYAILMTLMMTGIRVSELVALDRDDVETNERSGNLTVRSGKGNKERSIPLNVEARRAIQKYLGERSDEIEALFLSNRRERISVRSIQHLLGQYDVHPHQLRHTFIRGLVKENQDIAVIQSMSGHSSADMILRYSQPTEEDKMLAVESLFKS
ncbi:tyrosine-type recombinase/integrase [Tumebacillus flagellatus]|uniref:Integrase n=1 Tax=Tumebacillus flagellatus TaxID=1157490 RepID=A0A074LLN9_9BACL|nr:tyrosine-type recombinase/integrase [Tumebacillus flagellatus]KEO82004.1 integrase [Tumebacillus flagellatus]